MSVFGVSQIVEYARKTGKDTLTVSKLAKTLNVSEASAKRYIHEAVRLGVLEQKRKGTYKIDMEKAKLYLALSEAKDPREAALKLIGGSLLGRKAVKGEFYPMTILIPKQYVKHIEFILRHSIRGGELEKLGDDQHPVYVLKVIREEE